MEQAAGVRSIDAIRDFRADLHEFCEEVRSALVDVDLEVRRSLEWVLEQQPAFWRHEARKATDAITNTKMELSRARMRTLPGGGTPSCIEERKAVDRAERRLRHVEEKMEAVRGWGRNEQQEVNEYTGRATQLSALLDSEIPRALSFLDHAVANLESYLAIGDPGADNLNRTGKSMANKDADDASQPASEPETAEAKAQPTEPGGGTSP